MDPDFLSALAAWDLDHRALWLLPLAAVLYARGWRRLHREMPARYPAWRLASFCGGLTALFLAIASPLDTYGSSLLLVHMIQHLLLMMVAPPLIWIGQPVLPLIRAVPPVVARRAALLLRVGDAVTHPMVGWVSLALAMVVWHLPPLYELGLRSEGWHEVQHACFFTAALLFWWPVVGVWPGHARWPRWTMIPYLLTADIVNTAVSAVFSFSRHVIYPSYEAAPRLLGLSALDDQSIAGAIMWVPGSIAFLLPALVLTFRLLDTPRKTRGRRPTSAGRPHAAAMRVGASKRVETARATTVVPR